MLSLLLTGMALTTEAADTVTLLFAGDIMLGGKAGIEIQEKRDPFRHVAKLLGSADVRIGNLENPITDHAVATPNKPFVFKAAPQSAEVLAHHFDVLSLANNHMGDYGEQGVLDTLLHLNQQQIKAVGGGKTLASAHHPGLFTVNGISLAILAYNDFFPRRFEAMEQRAGVAWCDEDEIIFDIQQIKQADPTTHVILFMHWGEEHRSEANARQRKIAQRAIDHGASAVIGTHPHTIQNIEIYKNKPILYSLGNFVFDGFTDVDNNTGWLAWLTFDTQGAQSLTTQHVTLDTEGLPHPGETPFENLCWTQPSPQADHCTH